MSTNDEVKLDMPPENDENELVTSPQEHDVRDTATASEIESSGQEKVRSRTSPLQDQIDDPRINEDLKEKLYKYAKDGSWELAFTEIFKKNPLKNSEYLTARISNDGDIALHVAVAEKFPTFVDGLVKYMKKEDLAIKNYVGNTAFFLAAKSGRVDLAKKMLKKNVELPSVRGEGEMLPIEVAKRHWQTQMVEYLKQFQRPLEENRTDLSDDPEISEDLKKRLYRLAFRNDWRTAYRDFFKNSQIYLGVTISDRGDTALHVAVAANSPKFVRRLVNHMQKEDLAIKNNNGNTAFFLAALSGRVELAKLMFEANDELPKIRGNNKKKMLPIRAAAERGHKQMLEFLYNVSEKELKDWELFELLCSVLGKTDLFDFALNLLKKHPSVLDHKRSHEASVLDHKRSHEASVLDHKRIYHALGILAGTPMMSRDFANQNQEGFLKRDFKLYYSDRDKLPHEKLPPRTLELLKLLLEKLDSNPRKIDNLIKVAVKKENVELLSIIICDYYPEFISKAGKKSFSLLIHDAVLKRQEGILKLINRMNTLFEINESYTDDSENNILHLAGELPPSYLLDNIPGVALQMQYELWWFKEVRKIVNASDAQAKNVDKKTPIAVFNEKHSDLKEKGEKWMKDTANSCMIVAALIATVVFASAFTVPGGTKDESGTPHFLRKVSFTVFVISDAVSLVSSICSILTFLSILTSRYAEEDFLLALPTKLIAGLSTLLLSIVAMMVVFCTTIFIVFKDGNIWVPILVSAISSVPAILFLLQQRKLLTDVVLSTHKIKRLSNEEGRARELNKLSVDNDDDDDDDINKDNRRWKMVRYQYYKNRLQRCLRTFCPHCVRR